MKKNKKIIGIIASIVISIFSIGISKFNNELEIVSAATSNSSTTVKLRLNHNSYVYNKKGKRLKTYKGKKALIKKSKTLTIKGKIQPIKKIKRYFFYVYVNYDPYWKPYWLSYKKIKGDYYYSIGNKGYIKCVNVKTVNGNTLQASQAVVTVKPQIGKVAYARDNSGNTITAKTFKKGQKLVIDDTDIFKTGIGFSYHVKGTNYWIDARDLKANPRPMNFITNKL